jgi:hypothetical protein
MEDSKTEMTVPKDVRNALIGRTIVTMRWMRDSEMNLFGWYKRPMVLVCEDGTLIVFQSDDEGNDGGAAFIYNGEKETELICYTSR